MGLTTNSKRADWQDLAFAFRFLAGQQAKESDLSREVPEGYAFITCAKLLDLYPFQTDSPFALILPPNCLEILERRGMIKNESHEKAVGFIKRFGHISSAPVKDGEANQISPRDLVLLNVGPTALATVATITAVPSVMTVNDVGELAIQTTLEWLTSAGKASSFDKLVSGHFTFVANSVLQPLGCQVMPYGFRCDPKRLEVLVELPLAEARELLRKAADKVFTMRACLRTNREHPFADELEANAVRIWGDHDWDRVARVRSRLGRACVGTVSNKQGRLALLVEPTSAYDAQKLLTPKSERLPRECVALPQAGLQKAIVRGLAARATKAEVALQLLQVRVKCIPLYSFGASSKGSGKSRDVSWVVAAVADTDLSTYSCFTIGAQSVTIEPFQERAVTVPRPSSADSAAHDRRAGQTSANHPGPQPPERAQLGLCRAVLPWTSGLRGPPQFGRRRQPMPRPGHLQPPPTLNWPPKTNNSTEMPPQPQPVPTPTDQMSR